MRGKRIIQRNDYPILAEMYRCGYTLQQIGDRFGVSRERIRQILDNNFDISAERKKFSKKMMEDFKVAKGERAAKEVKQYINNLREKYKQLSSRFYNAKAFYKHRLNQLNLLEEDCDFDYEVDKWLKG